VPDANPMTKEKVELGRHLFYDKRLSENQTQACASCHQQAKAFTDGKAQGVGSTGEVHPRGPQSLVNVAYLTALTWANPVIPSLEEQALVPLFGETPVELGMSGKEDELSSRLSADPVYVELFGAAFPESRGAVTLEHVTMAIASFERSILSYRSAYDRYAYGGDPTALSDSAKRGRTLFFGEKLECFHCHGGFNFSDSVMHDGTTLKEVMFHNTGLYNIDGAGSYPPDNQGIYAFSHVSSDMGRFRAPTLRNIALTAPYMHDGSISDLDGVLDHYAAGGRTITSGPYAGIGSANPFKSELLKGFTLSADERDDVKAFLASLTDEPLLSDPALADPWAGL
jgi:cytochrome c peroxidase